MVRRAILMCFVTMCRATLTLLCRSPSLAQANSSEKQAVKRYHEYRDRYTKITMGIYVRRFPTSYSAFTATADRLVSRYLCVLNLSLNGSNPKQLSRLML